MTREEAIAIIENEKECVNRANKNEYCNRDCYNCELVKTDTEILTALDMAIKALEQYPKYVPIAVIKYDKDKLKELMKEAVLTVAPQEPKMESEE